MLGCVWEHTVQIRCIFFAFSLEHHSSALKSLRFAKLQGAAVREGLSDLWLFVGALVRVRTFSSLPSISGDRASAFQLQRSVMLQGTREEDQELSDAWLGVDGHRINHELEFSVVPTNARANATLP